MKKISACIFDLDGVLVHTDEYHYKAWKTLANDLGFELTEKDNLQLKGLGRMATLNKILKIGKIYLHEKEKQELANRKNQIYVKSISTITLKDIAVGVEDFFRELQTQKIKIALGSSSRNATRILNQLELTSYFDAIVDGTKISEGKPNPLVFLKGAELLGVSASECVVFEDAEPGIKAALNANMNCVGIGHPNILKAANFVIPGFENFSFHQLNTILS